MTSLGSVLAATSDALQVPEPPRYVGVYLLIWRKRVVYVGQTTNLHQRLAHHRSRGWFQFSAIRWIPVAEVDLCAYEGALIRALDPRHCRRAPPCGGRDAEILATLGLQLDPERKFERREAQLNAKHGRKLRGLRRRYRLSREQRSAA